MHTATVETSLPSRINSPVCALCLNPDTDDLNQCVDCDEYICNSCPNMACASAGNIQSTRTLQTQLRRYALELGDLRTQRSLMGAESLTTEQMARLHILSELVSTMQAEAVRLDDERLGIFYVGDTLMTDTLSPALRALKVN